MFSTIIDYYGTTMLAITGLAGVLYFSYWIIKLSCLLIMFSVKHSWINIKNTYCDFFLAYWITEIEKNPIKGSKHFLVRFKKESREDLDENKETNDNKETKE